jgi:hypothetical protein
MAGIRIGLAIPSLVAAAILGSSASAQDFGRWKLSEGRGSASATVYSLNTLTTGTRNIDYRPILIISCDAKRYPVWRQIVQVRRAISGDGTARVTIRYDNAGAFEEDWLLADMSRSLQWDGGEGVARLTRARRFYLSWRFGVFSGAGEAVFDVAGIKEVAGELGVACGVRLP